MNLLKLVADHRARWPYCLIIGLAVVFGFATPFLGQADPKSPPPKPVEADAKATGEWLAGLFTVQQGHLQFAGKSSGDFPQARIPFTRPVEIKLLHPGMIADQQGLYPVLFKPTVEGYRVEMCTPFHPFFDTFISVDKNDGPFGYKPHPKAEAMTTTGFRTIGEILHAHFTKIAGHLPTRHRVLDGIGFPSESYIWEMGKDYLVLRAYDANDNDGISVEIATGAAPIDGFRGWKRTEEKIFEGWEKPLPDQASPAK